MEAKEVFEILVREHAAGLMVFIRSLIADSAAAEDVFQETLLTAWKNMERFDRERPFGPWLRGIAGKLALGWYRQRGRQPISQSETIIELIDSRLTAIQNLQGDTFNEKLEALRECMSHLPGSYQQAIHLRYEQQLMPGAITEITNATLETVKKRLNRARLLLMACINRKLNIAESTT